MKMSTSFNVCFEQFLLTIDDPKFINNYTEEALALELSRYIYRAIGICRDYLNKDINNYTPTTVDGVNYTIGSFNDDLNYQEISFISRGMTIPYLEFQLQKQKHLNQIVYGRDYQVRSQSQHIREVREVIDNTEKRLKQDMIMYSYLQSKDKLKGLGGI
jgi:hypothetical protein